MQQKYSFPKSRTRTKPAKKAAKEHVSKKGAATTHKAGASFFTDTRIMGNCNGSIYCASLLGVSEDFRQKVCNHHFDTYREGHPEWLWLFANPAAQSKTSYLCGTSAFAQGMFALYKTRIELARAGCSRAELEALGSNDVTAHTLRIPYFLQFKSEFDAGELISALVSRGNEIGLNVTCNKDEHVFHVSDLDTAQLALNLNNGDSVKPENSGVSVTVTLLWAESMVKIVVVLDPCYLEHHGWTRLVSWGNAYPEKRYEAIFNDVVRGMFKIDSGEVPPPRNGSKSVQDSMKDDAVVTYLLGTLIYPGDFDPDTELAKSFVCKKIWPDWLQGLRDEYEAAVNGGKAA